MVGHNLVILALGSVMISWVGWEICHQVLHFVRILLRLPSLATEGRSLLRIKSLLAKGPSLPTGRVLQWAQYLLLKFPPLLLNRLSDPASPSRIFVNRMERHGAIQACPLILEVGVVIQYLLGNLVVVNNGRTSSAVRWTSSLRILGVPLILLSEI
jgi:hypothetical protein